VSHHPQFRLPDDGPSETRKLLDSGFSDSLADLPRRRPRAAFTLVEIMIVVVIIGILAALGIPAMKRVIERSQTARIANDFRQFHSSFQRYVMETGQWPAPAAGGVIPAGMDGYLPETYKVASPMGGSYWWSGPSQNIVLRSSQATDAIMQRVDALLDDGDLTTGEFGKTASVGYHYRVR